LPRWSPQKWAPGPAELRLRRGLKIILKLIVDRAVALSILRALAELAAVQTAPGEWCEKDEETRVDEWRNAAILAAPSPPTRFGKRQNPRCPGDPGVV
jgi:hypothetical protein